MKFFCFIFCLLLFANFKTSAQINEIDSSAYKIVKQHLDKISSYLKSNPESSNKYSPEFNFQKNVDFLTSLTGIPSESSGNYGGQFPPTLNDYKRWELWLYCYKENIRLDTKKNKIIVYKEVEL